jgi:2-dehydropantoate 2-reductase
VRVCVFGAGSVGGHMAGRLAQNGAEVSLVVRGAHLAAIQARGLRVTAPDGTIEARVAASADPADLGPQDAVIVSVKAPSLPSVAAGIRPLLGRDTAVAFVMNGIPWWYFHEEGGPHDGTRLARIDPGDAVWNAVGPQRAIGGVINSSCIVVEPGVVAVSNAQGRVAIGEPNGRMSERLQALAAAMHSEFLVCEAVPRIRERVWAKLLLNFSLGPLNVLTQAPIRDVLAEPELEAAVRRASDEVAAIAHAMGCTVTPNVDEQKARAATGPAHTPSILQDLQLGRPMEVDAMFGVPLEIARLAGVPTPTLDLLVAMVKLRARRAGLY